MWKTPGVRGLLTRAWIALIDHPTRHIEYKFAMGQVLGSFMAVSRQANLEEVVSAAGGTLADLAELIVRSVGGASRLITSQECILEDAPNEEFNRGLVDGILDFVIQALRCEPGCVIRSRLHGDSPEGCHCVDSMFARGQAVCFKFAFGFLHVHRGVPGPGRTSGSRLHCNWRTYPPGHVDFRSPLFGKARWLS